MARNLNTYSYQQIHDKKLAESVSVGAIVQVTEFDPIKMTVNVQPLSKHLENGKYESQPPILKIPVAVTHCANLLFRPWYQEGDVGVVLYLDHDLDATVSSGQEAKPLTERNHSTSDAVFIGGIVAGDYEVPDLPENSIVLATDDGGVYVAVTDGKILIKGDVEVNGKISATGDVVAENAVSGAHHTHRGDSGGTTGQPQ